MAHQPRALPAWQPAQVVDAAPVQQRGQFGLVDTEPQVLTFNLDFHG
ncbi:hypothetical protein [Xanthomonas campestris]